jgi:hypothetical protein
MLAGLERVETVLEGSGRMICDQAVKLPENLFSGYW